MDKNESILKIKNLTKIYTAGRVKVKALNDINLEIYKGEILVIMGSSGSGKSTLLNILGGLDSPTDGKIYMDGEKIENFSTEPFATEYRRNKVGFVFQFFNLLNDLTVEENVALPLILKGMHKDEIAEKTDKLLKLVGLENKKKNRPIELSGGQQQRVAIARALIHEPSILFADEPTGNLDHSTTNEILELIKTTKDKLNQTVVIVTHDPKVATYSDRILFFDDGNIVDEYINNPSISEEKRNEAIFTKFKRLNEVKKK